jgi:hypothetical protein
MNLDDLKLLCHRYQLLGIQSALGGYLCGPVPHHHLSANLRVLEEHCQGPEEHWEDPYLQYLGRHLS